MWSSQFQFFVQGKELLEYLDGTAARPASSATATEKKIWNTSNARVFSWLLCSIEQSIALTLRSLTSTADVWKHLKNTYSQVNNSRVFEVEYELAKLTQGELDVRSFFNVAHNLWTEQDILADSLLDAGVGTAVKKERDRSRLLQFLMRLRPEFEAVRSQLLSANKLDVDQILGELVRVETRLKTQALLDGTAADPSNVFATRPQFQHRNQTFSPSSGGNDSPNRSSGPYLSNGELKCRHCSESGHITSHCRKRNFCNYCKRPGHIILDCTHRKGAPIVAGNNMFQRLQTNLGYSRGQANSTQPANDSSSSSNSVAVDSDARIKTLVQEALKAALSSALQASFSTFGMTGISRKWYLDSGSFNHMTSDKSLFHHYKPIHNMAIEVANGAQLSVAGIGDVKTNLFIFQILYMFQNWSQTWFRLVS
ncbi:hypothetical protein LINGRAHAP2_LOCUS6860 [Linum grandiflorum]